MCLGWNRFLPSEEGVLCVQGLESLVVQASSTPGWLQIWTEIEVVQKPLILERHVVRRSISCTQVKLGAPVGEIMLLHIAGTRVDSLLYLASVISPVIIIDERLYLVQECWQRFFYVPIVTNTNPFLSILGVIITRNTLPPLVVPSSLLDDKGNCQFRKACHVLSVGQPRNLNRSRRNMSLTSMEKTPVLSSTSTVSPTVWTYGL